MKKIELATASRPLAEYADELEDEILVLTADGKPVAAIVSLKDVDPESWALSTSGVFQELIEKARAEIEMGKSLSLEEEEGGSILTSSTASRGQGVGPGNRGWLSPYLR